MADQHVLKARRVLHGAPARVQAPDFVDPEQAFFDPQDKAQVKYEMLRKVHVEGEPVQTVCQQFGLSRARFYQVREQFEQAGVAGLLDGVPGRKGPTKLTPEIVSFVLQQRESHPELSGPQIRDSVQQTFRVQLTTRTIDLILQGKYALRVEKVKKNE